MRQYAHMASIDGTHIVPWASALLLHSSGHPFALISMQLCMHDPFLSCVHTPLSNCRGIYLSTTSFWRQLGQQIGQLQCMLPLLQHSTRPNPISMYQPMAWVCMQARQVFWCSPLHTEVWTPAGEWAVPDTSHCLGPQL